MPNSPFQMIPGNDTPYHHTSYWSGVSLYSKGRNEAFNTGSQNTNTIVKLARARASRVCVPVRGMITWNWVLGVPVTICRIIPNDRNICGQWQQPGLQT
ncbi:hypothetical protein TNCV_2118051 [Trichonephila clavipes]|nr:hypothetical protein TNCV_2118051 [Trichonephila clavipes]